MAAMRLDELMQSNKPLIYTAVLLDKLVHYASGELLEERWRDAGRNFSGAKQTQKLLVST